jgi:hypothetical protein
MTHALLFSQSHLAPVMETDNYRFKNAASWVAMQQRFHSFHIPVMNAAFIDRHVRNGAFSNII